MLSPAACSCLLAGSVQPNYAGGAARLSRTRASLPVTLPRTCSWQLAWSEPRAGSSFPSQRLKSPRRLRREKGVLQTLGQPCCFLPLPQGGSRRLQPRGRGVSSSARFNLAVLIEIQAGARGTARISGSGCLVSRCEQPERRGRLVFPRGWLSRAGGVCRQRGGPYLMVSALLLGFQARFPQQRAPRPPSACWGRIRTARTARVTDERPSQPQSGERGLSPPPS